MKVFLFLNFLFSSSFSFIYLRCHLLAGREKFFLCNLTVLAEREKRGNLERWRRGGEGSERRSFCFWALLFVWWLFFYLFSFSLSLVLKIVLVSPYTTTNHHHHFSLAVNLGSKRLGLSHAVLVDSGRRRLVGFTEQ